MTEQIVKELRQSSFIQELILYGVKVFYDFYKKETTQERGFLKWWL